MNDNAARKQMLEQERNLHILVDNAPDMILRYDRCCRLTYANAQLEVALGISVQNILGKTPKQTVTDGRYDVYEAALKRVISSGKDAESYLAVHDSYGAETNYLMRMSPELDDSGKVINVFVIGHDVTERVRMENAFRAKEHEFHSLAESLPDNIARWDKEGRYVYVNSVCERTLETSLANLIGKVIDEVFPDGHFAPLAAGIAHVVATGETITTLRQATRFENGETQIHDIKLLPERDATGKIIGVLGLGRDMTDFYRLQDDLEAKEKELRALAESTPGMMGSFYARADGSVCMPYVSPNIEKLFGLRPQDVADDASPLLALNHPDDAQRIKDSIAESARSMTNWHEEFRILHPTRGERWIESNTNPQLHPEGGVIWYGYLHDITERKRAEKLEQFRNHTLEILSSSTSLPAILESIVRGVEQLNPEMLCSILLLDSQGKHLIDGVAPSLPDFFVAATNGLEIGMGVGSCGTAAFTGERVIVEDIQTHPYWAPAKEIAAKAGLAACWSQPILSSSGQVLGTFAIYHREVNSPSEADISIIEKTAHLSSIAIEHKHMEKALFDSEREFRSLAEHLPDNIARWDTEGRYLYINPIHERTLGASAKDMLGKKIPDTHVQVKAGIAQVVSTGEAVLSVHQPVLVNGEIQMHDVSMVPERDAAGNVVAVLGLGRDMTEFYSMQAAIAAREQEFRSLAESSPDFVIRAGRDLRIRYLNANMVKFLELGSAQEAIGRQSIEIWQDGRFKEIDAARERAVATGERVSIEVAVPTAEGNIAYHHIVTVPERDAVGHIIGTLGFGRDITAIRETEQRLGGLVENLPGVAYTLRLSSQGAHSFPYVSAGVKEMYGITPEAAMGDFTAMHGLVHPEDKPGMEALLAESARAMTAFRAEVRICPPGLPERWLDVRSDPQALPDGGILWFGLIFDITERKRLEVEIRASEAELRARSELLHAVLESSPDMINFALDQSYRYIAFNSMHKNTMHAIWGKDISLGMNMLEVIGDHSDHNAAKKCFDRALAGECFTLEEAYGDEGLLRQYWQNHYAPMYSEEGKVVGMTCFVLNVTERKKAEEALRESQEKLSELFKLSPLGLALTDMQGRYIEFNEAFRVICGYPAEELMTLDYWTLTPKEYEVQEAEQLESLARIGRYGPYEKEYRQKDGTLIPIRLNGTLVTGKDGKKFIWSIVEDIRERKQAEAQLKKKFAEIVELNNQLEINARDLEDQAAEFEAQAVELEASQAQILQTEAWYRSIVRSAPDGMVVVNASGNIVLVNLNIEKMFGYEEDELIGQPVEILLPQDVRHGHVAKRDGFFSSEVKGRPMDAVVFGLRACRKDGSEFPVYISLSRLPVLEGQAGIVCAAIRDITEHKRMEDALAKREYESRTLVDNSPDNISRYDRDCRRTFVNPAFAASVDGGVAALLGKAPTECPGGPNAELFETKIRETFETGLSGEFELIWPNKAGREICSHVRITPERDAEGKVVSVLTVGRDITELNEHRKRIHQMAFYDLLTSLPNRALFNDRLRQMITDAAWHKHLAGVMLLDLDRFKSVNDTLGHPAGDSLLCEAAARLGNCVRSYDTVARLGGDEFAILLPEIRSGDDLGRVANKIVNAFKEPFLLEGKEAFVTTSVGISVYPSDSEDGDDLFKQADSAMYFAKRSGRGTFRFYSKDLSDISSERLLLESDLHRGFVRGELELYYQPKVRLTDGMLIGSEALLRWNHPQRGMVPPGKFIAIAEDSGLIVEIGERVLRDACRVACEWNSQGKPLHKVAINLSARQFQSNDILGTVRRVLEDTHCNPEWIELEITESLLLDEGGDVLKTLESFRSMGITIAIDDFGTGYSSLSYLARFPIDTLKIDQSFTSKLTEGGHHSELVKAIISIARSLTQKIVAEGVETIAQAAMLQAYGCHVAQGYLYSRPISKAAFETLPRSFEMVHRSLG